MMSIFERVGMSSIHRLGMYAVLGAIAGAVAAIPVLPSAVRGLLLLAFMCVGPGSAAIVPWKERLPAVVTRALVPTVGLAITILVVSLFLLAGAWAPRPILLAMAVATLAIGLFELSWDRRKGHAHGVHRRNA